MALPVAAAAAVVVWLLCGLVGDGLWLPFACFAVTVYLLVEINNQNALLRVRSRMVSATFIMLSCTASFLFPQTTGAVVQLALTLCYMLLFQTYQSRTSTGRTYFAFLALSAASLLWVHILWIVPVLWVLMATQLQSLSWRTWLASLLAIATPYWIILLAILSPLTTQLSPLTSQLSLLTTHLSPPDYNLSAGRIMVFALILVMAAVSVAHFVQYSFEDKIRIRLLYGFFTAATAVFMLLILLQPQHYDVLIRLAIVSASPLIAHVMTFTASRLSNILFFCSAAIVIALAAYNLIQN